MLEAHIKNRLVFLILFFTLLKTGNVARTKIMREHKKVSVGYILSSFSGNDVSFMIVDYVSLKICVRVFLPQSLGLHCF